MSIVQIKCGQCGALNQGDATASAIQCGQCGAINQLQAPPPTVVAAEAVMIEPGAQTSNVLTSSAPATDSYTGLSVLALVDGFRIKQEREYMEAAAQAIGVGYESNNKYKIMDNDGRQLFMAEEETGFCWRCCCKTKRPFNMHIKDNTGEQVLTFTRKWTWCECAWFDFCLEDVEVWSGKHDREEGGGTLIGKVTQPKGGGCFYPTTFISDKEGTPQLSVKGPFCIGKFCDSTFEVLGSDENVVGTVVRDTKLRDVLSQALTDADNFHIQFPKDMAIETKATAIAATMLVDFMFFEVGGSAQADLANQSVSFHLCTCYCLGCPMPCVITLGGNNGDGGGGGGGE